MKDTNGNIYTDVDQVTLSTSDGIPPEEQGDTGIFYSEWVPQGTHTFQILLQGQWWQVQTDTPSSGFAVLTPKFGPSISQVVPSAGGPNTLNLAGGSLISVYGGAFANTVAQPNSFPLPTEAAGVRLTANGQPLGLLYVGPTQINAYLPPSSSGLVQLRVSNAQGQDHTTVWIEPSVPAIFSLNGTGAGAALAVNALTNQIISGSSPARAGDYVVLFVTGLGPTYRSDGLDFANTMPQLILGSQEVNVAFAGLTPGFVGLYQVNFQVPASVPRGMAVPVTLSGPRFGSNVTTLAVQ